jgi:AraC family transcriptional regulator, arabinose operon regulatory protein
LERGYAIRDQVAAAAALRHALSTVAQLAITPRDMRSAYERVAVSVETLRRDWQRPHRLDELATGAGVSVTHYSALFRRHTGFAPIDFLIRLRVQHACRLLDTTKLPVGEIAERVGYRDPYYFTRCFRRVMGCAPRRYRKVPKG